MASELRTGFVQAMTFVRPIGRWQVDSARKHANWEGRIHTCSFTTLRDELLRDATWVPTGWAHVMCWLALGAPHLSGHIRFGSLTARELFDEVMEHAHKIEFPDGELAD